MAVCFSVSPSVFSCLWHFNFYLPSPLSPYFPSETMNLILILIYSIKLIVLHTSTCLCMHSSTFLHGFYGVLAASVHFHPACHPDIMYARMARCAHVYPRTMQTTSIYTMIHLRTLTHFPCGFAMHFNVTFPVIHTAMNDFLFCLSLTRAHTHRERDCSSGMRQLILITENHHPAEKKKLVQLCSRPVSSVSCQLKQLC